MKFVFTLLSIVFICNYSSAQQACNFVVDAGEDTVLCEPATITLNGFTNLPVTSITTINWQPSSGLSDSTLLNPSVTVNGNATYVLTVGTASANLVFNGDFSLGDTGFTSSYIPGTGGISGIIHNEGEYDINTIPKNSHIDFAIFGDHTTGTGNMMVINGSYLLNDTLWSQTVNVSPNTAYNFSAWAATANWQNPAVLRYTINGVILGPDLTLTSDTGVWENFSAPWNSGSSTTAQICIFDITTDVTGNDFVIDDISLTGSCILSDTISITVDSAPPLSLGNDLSFCSGDIIFINGGSGYSNYQWQVNGIISFDTDSVIEVTGPATYILTVTTIAGCQLSDTLLVVPGVANINLPSDTIVCDGDTIMLNAPQGFTTYQWIFNGLPVSNSSSIQTSQAGTYQLIVSDSSGCTANDSIIVMNEILSLDAGSDQSVCPGDSTIINLTGSPGLTYQFNFNGVITTLDADSVYLTLPGAYGFTGVALSGCTVTDSILIVQAPEPELQTINDTSICAGTALQLITSGATGYQWSPSTFLDNANVPSPFAMPLSDITYTVTGINQQGCTATANISITVLEPPVAEFSFSSTLSCYGMDVVTQNASENAVAYLWDFGDGVTSSDNNPVHIYENPGNYILQLVAVNGSCSDTATMAVTFSETVLQPLSENIFSPNGDGYNECFDGGINPLLAGCSRLEIFTRWGQTVFVSSPVKTCWNGKNDSDRSDVPEGTYFYLLSYRSETIKGTVYVKR